MSEDIIPAEYKTAEGLRTLANYLRSSKHGVKGKSGIEHEKRIDYFRGKKMVECLLAAEHWPKSIPKMTDRGVICMVANKLINGQFFHRSEKVEDKKGHFKISQKNVFEESGYYTWMYAGNTFWSNFATGMIVALVVGFTLLPIWPTVAKKALWWCSVTFLICTLSFTLIRFLLFLVMWIFGYDLWILPRLFDESLSFQDSFRPAVSFEKAAGGQQYYRMGTVLAIAGAVYWATTQPTEFDGLLQAQKTFVDDLYSGKLLADVAHISPQANMDRNNKVPNLADLIREMEADAIAEKSQEEQDADWVRANSDEPMEEDAEYQQQPGHNGDDEEDEDNENVHIDEDDDDNSANDSNSANDDEL